jgi:phosphoribosylglycinamide formyltransferase-1
MTVPIAVLVSGRGTNLQAILDAIRDRRLDAHIVLVASARAEAPALARARTADVPSAVFAVTKDSRGDAQGAMGKAVRAAGAELIVLAGYGWILAEPFWDAIGEIPVINTHPSLLPAFGGLNRLKVHAAVLKAGVAETGCTVHRAYRGMLDEGEVLVQRRVPIYPGDEPVTLEVRVLAAEHIAVVEAIALFARPAERAR